MFQTATIDILDNTALRKTLRSNQTWIHRKFLTHMEVSSWEHHLYKSEIFQQATFEYQKVYLIVVPLFTIDWR